MKRHHLLCKCHQIEKLPALLFHQAVCENDGHKYRKYLAGGIAGSDYFRLLSESVLKNKPSPGGLGQMCKDVSIVVNTVRQVNMPAYIATAASKYFSAAEDMDMSDREGADLIEVVERISGNDK